MEKEINRNKPLESTTLDTCNKVDRYNSIVESKDQQENTLFKFEKDFKNQIGFDYSKVEDYFRTQLDCYKWKVLQREIDGVDGCKRGDAEYCLGEKANDICKIAESILLGKKDNKNLCNPKNGYKKTCNALNELKKKLKDKNYTVSEVEINKLITRILSEKEIEKLIGNISELNCSNDNTNVEQCNDTGDSKDECKSKSENVSNAFMFKKTFTCIKNALNMLKREIANDAGCDLKRAIKKNPAIGLYCELPSISCFKNKKLKRKNKKLKRKNKKRR